MASSPAGFKSGHHPFKRPAIASFRHAIESIGPEIDFIRGGIVFIRRAIAIVRCAIASLPRAIRLMERTSRVLRRAILSVRGVIDVVRRAIDTLRPSIAIVRRRIAVMGRMIDVLPLDTRVMSSRDHTSSRKRQSEGRMDGSMRRWIPSSHDVVRTMSRREGIEPPMIAMSRHTDGFVRDELRGS